MMILKDLAGVAFILLLCGVLTNLVWHSVRLGMTPTPSSRKAVRAVNSLLAAHHRTGRVIDLGSGFGTLVIALARKHPDIQFTGYEYSLIPMLWSSIICRLNNVRNCEIQRRNFFKEPFAPGTTLVCYLSPDLMAGLKKKLLSDNRGEILIISNTFGFRNWPPLQEIRLNDTFDTRVYVYRISTDGKFSEYGI